MARLYSNENFPLRVVRALRDLGHDVLTSHEAGRANQRIPDEEVLHYATVENRSVITLNQRDFVLLHHADNRHGGIIVCTPDPDTAAFAERIHTALENDGGETAGKLIRIVRPG